MWLWVARASYLRLRFAYPFCNGPSRRSPFLCSATLPHDYLDNLPCSLSAIPVLNDMEFADDDEDAVVRLGRSQLDCSRVSASDLTKC